MYKVFFDVNLGEKTFPCTLTMELDGRFKADRFEDAESQLFDVVCSKYSRDKDDERILLAQAFRIFRTDFLNALNGKNVKIKKVVPLS